MAFSALPTPNSEGGSATRWADRGLQADGIHQSKLNTIDLIENYYVLELSKDYAKVKIKYLGKIDKMKEKLAENGINIEILNNSWKLKLI